MEQQLTDVGTPNNWRCGPPKSVETEIRSKYGTGGRK